MILWVPVTCFKMQQNENYLWNSITGPVFYCHYFCVQSPVKINFHSCLIPSWIIWYIYVPPLPYPFQCAFSYFCTTSRWCNLSPVLLSSYEGISCLDSCFNWYFCRRTHWTVLFCYLGDMLLGISTFSDASWLLVHIEKNSPDCKADI